MKIKVGISNKHIHITEEDFKALFNHTNLTKRNDLSQHNEFASNETVSIKGPKGEFNNVRILGPFRNYTQVEISKTDAIKLGIDPPIKPSGDLDGAAEIEIINNNAHITRKCCIIANRHIHLNKEEQNKYRLNNPCTVKINTEKPAILENVYLKIDDNYNLELHLDTDDGNATLLKTGDEVEIIK